MPTTPRLPWSAEALCLDGSENAAPPACPDDGLAAFLSVRHRLFGIACRMLGSAAEAEDIVQDVWVRWQTTDRSVVRNAPAFLAITATRLAINIVRSARSRREVVAGPSLREPVDASADPRSKAERREALETAVQVLLEKLSPAERGAYVLREAFDYPYRDIANILRLEEAHTRQLVGRARQHVADARLLPASAARRKRLLDAFIRAAHSGDVADLERLFASQRSATGRPRLRRSRTDESDRLATGTPSVPTSSAKCDPLARTSIPSVAVPTP